MAGKSKYNPEFKLAIIAQVEARESATQVARENGLVDVPNGMILINEDNLE